MASQEGHNCVWVGVGRGWGCVCGGGGGGILGVRVGGVLVWGGGYRIPEKEGAGNCY